MKLLFIKISKVWNTLKRDGLHGALKSAWLVLRPIGKGEVLIITGGVGDSARYRAFNVAEELKLHGIAAKVAIQNSPFLPQVQNNFKVFIFHRVFADSKIRRLIEGIKQKGKLIIFDTDDLLFDSQFIKKTDYFEKINPLQRMLFDGGLGAEILNDPYVDVCTATTSYLAAKLKERGKKAFIVPNKLSNKDLEMADNLNKSKIIQNSKFQNQNSIKIGYFSGTISHNKDFATITDALLEIMKKYSRVALVLAGPLDIENKLNEFKDRVKQIPYVSREKHFANISTVDINLAPLKIGDPFCEAKSELKFFEAGIFKVPTVAVANLTFKNAILDGIDGFVASSTAEWVEKLSRLIEDSSLRKAIGEKAYAKALADYANINSHNEEYYNYLRSKLTNLKTD